MRQVGCVFQDTEPPEFLSILRKGTQVLGPIRRVRFTRAPLRQANIQESRRPSLNRIQVKSSHQRSPYAVKFEARSQEETERQVRCARGDARKLAKNIIKLKETEKATLYSPSDEWVSAGRIHNKTEGKGICCRFRGEHAHEDHNSAELESVRASESPTTVVTANSEVLTKEEATVNVRELDLFLTEMLLEDTPAVLSLEKTLRRSRLFLRVEQWPETTSHQQWQEDQLDHSELRTLRFPWSIDKFFNFIFAYFSCIFIARHRDSHGVFSIKKK